jgi:hypothetical protein
MTHNMMRQDKQAHKLIIATRVTNKQANEPTSNHALTEVDGVVPAGPMLCIAMSLRVRLSGIGGQP